jgi:hypothetical protein
MRGPCAAELQIVQQAPKPASNVPADQLERAK